VARRTRLFPLAAATALVLAPAASAAYTKPTLTVSQSGATTRIVVTADAREDATARIAVYVPKRTAIAPAQAAGAVIGTAKAQVSALQLGGALLPLEGTIAVAAPGQAPAALQSACTQGQQPLATWVVVLQAVGQTLTVPAFLLATAGAETELGPAKLVLCLPPPEVPTAQGGATLGAKLVQAQLTVRRVFGRVRAGAWVGLWTPYPVAGQAAVGAPVASPSMTMPGRVTLKLTRVGAGATRLTGTVTQGGSPRAATVRVFAGARATGLRRVTTVSAGAGGRFAVVLRGPSRFVRVSAAAGARSAPRLCRTLALPAACVNPRLGAFSAGSRVTPRP
jgi:hypothetical protein